MGCPYAAIFGKPGTGPHAWRIGFGNGVAVVDTLLTILVAILTSYLWDISLFNSIVAWFLIGEILHLLFGVQTAVLTFFGLVAC